MLVELTPTAAPEGLSVELVHLELGGLSVSAVRVGAAVHVGAAVSTVSTASISERMIR